jgi:mercuric ion transport protein
MPTLVDRARAVLPSGLTGMAGLACAACCAIPVLLAAGVLSGAGWAAAGAWMPGIAVALIALAAGAWWWVSRRRHGGGCDGGTSCDCATSSSA